MNLRKDHLYVACGNHVCDTYVCECCYVSGVKFIVRVYLDIEGRMNLFSDGCISLVSEEGYS